ncbi:MULTISPECIES: FAD-dependent oxidoreductase [unclassified Saccharopolyspora]|uniref:FAD-dependent oxidoreductase n=1 Tax=unclassified Saccharopolyspora TaxID=2646250 RepID=UPI001CD629B3|nr:MULTISPECIES: FAD-dependent oxidoreductase [unclassified Saccharopolyspora]MCA1185425.1 FAD-binding oxidoreductase [Saccharopolyspora sp. 6T]MCA1225234.1 FAD-binding oxidoreductase [Saccharopolyspora sp. 6M]
MAANGTVLVIGAGVSGLSTAVILAESGVPVRVRTDEPPADTTSAVAGAIWGPALLQPADRVRRWVADTYRALVELAADDTSGVHLATGRMAARVDLGDQLPPEALLLPDLRRCTPDELPAGFRSGYRATLPLIDMPRYLEHLTGRLLAAGGELLISPVSSLADAAAEADRIVNCTGVGAHELVGDPGVRPVRGQHVLVRNPGISEYFVEVGAGPEFTSYVPHGDQVVLGGVAGEHDWSRAHDRDDSAAVLRRCAQVEPLLAGAEVLGETVGLRPGRDAVRLETERFGGATVVHDYGHSGCGVSLSWGCAAEAAGLVLGRPVR